jgi:hypothetical protein
LKIYELFTYCESEHKWEKAFAGSEDLMNSLTEDALIEDEKINLNQATC